MQQRPGSIGSASMWMFVLSILLFWLPVVGPLIAGFIGGRKAGSVGNALIAALLPAVIIGVALFLLASVLTAVPLLGLVAGAGGFIIAMAHVGPLLLGALVGAIV